MAAPAAPTPCEIFRTPTTLQIRLRSRHISLERLSIILEECFQSDTTLGFRRKNKEQEAFVFYFAAPEERLTQVTHLFFNILSKLFGVEVVKLWRKPFDITELPEEVSRILGEKEKRKLLLDTGSQFYRAILPGDGSSRLCRLVEPVLHQEVSEEGDDAASVVVETGEEPPASRKRAPFRKPLVVVRRPSSRGPAAGQGREGPAGGSGAGGEV